MNFSKVIGKIDKELVKQAENFLTQIFVELGTKYDNTHIGSKLGGDAMVFSLMYPIEHICTLNIPTAATDGKRFYWNPKFVLKQSKIGLRIICAHEAWHAVYMHPARRGSRLPRLWNIAVDYIVNGTAMDDLKNRKLNAAEVFEKNLGKYMPLEKYAEMLKNPFAKIKGFEDLDPSVDSSPTGKLPKVDDDRELTDEEIKELEKREKGPKFYFADPDLPEDMKNPNKIYDYLFNLLPKCPKCGSVGVYSLPQNGKGKKGSNPSKGKKKKDKGSGDGNQPGDSSQPGDSDQGNQGGGQSCDSNGQSCCGPCDQCGGGFDIFGLGGTVDEHMDTEESQEKLSKRIYDAMETTRKMAGHVPAALEDELGKLTAPKIKWTDVIRSKMTKVRNGNDRNDWTKFKTRPMFSGMMVPKRRSYAVNFGCLLDTSGSMSKDDMAYGLSQLASLDERSEGTIVPNDCNVYWDQATKIKKCKLEELQKVKVVGRGGTAFAQFFDEYEANIGKCDFLIVLTDGYLCDTDIAEMKNPGIPVYWVITSNNDSFTAPFGRVMPLRD